MRIPEGYVNKNVPRITGDIEMLPNKRVFIVHFQDYFGGFYIYVHGRIKLNRLLARHWRVYGNDKLPCRFNVI
jgi:hypothetical protein